MENNDQDSGRRKLNLKFAGLVIVILVVIAASLWYIAPAMIPSQRSSGCDESRLGARVVSFDLKASQSVGVSFQRLDSWDGFVTQFRAHIEKITPYHGMIEQLGFKAYYLYNSPFVVYYYRGCDT